MPVYIVALGGLEPKSVVVYLCLVCFIIKYSHNLPSSLYLNNGPLLGDEFSLSSTHRCAVPPPSSEDSREGLHTVPFKLGWLPGEAPLYGAMNNIPHLITLCSSVARSRASTWW